MKKISAFTVSCLFAVAFCAAQTQTGGSGFRQEGIASWYGAEFEGRPTASGELFDPNQFTAAHPDLPFGTVLIVTNAVNGQRVMVRVNDRGPFIKSRIIDISRAAAEQLNMLETGTAQVIVELAPRNAVAGSPSGGANSEGARTPVTSTAVLPDPREEEEGPDTASIAEAAPAQPDQETRTDADTAVVPDTAAEPDMTVEPGSLAPSSAGRQAGVTLPANPAAPAYTPQQPVLAQTAPQTPARVPAQTPVAQPARPGTAASQPSSSRVPAQASVTQPRQMAPQTLPASPGTASRSQSASVPPGSVPVASFQPIPTVTRPPATTGAAPIMPNSAMVTSIPSAPVQTQPQRNQPVYASAEIAGGPFVSGRYYRLQIGSYKVARNAVDVFDRLSAAGLNPQWEPYGDLYRVVISNVRAEDINTLAVRLGNAGFKEAIAREER